MFDSSHLRIELLPKVAVELQSNFRYIRFVGFFNSRVENNFESFTKAFELITSWRWIEAEQIRMIGAVDARLVLLVDIIWPYAIFCRQSLGL